LVEKTKKAETFKHRFHSKSGIFFKHVEIVVVVVVAVQYVPRNEEWFSEVIIDTDNQVFIGNSIYLRPWKLTINQDPLQHKKKELQQ
jgi:hypothetical protein